MIKKRKIIILFGLLLLFLLISLAFSTTLNNNIIAYYDFNETSGSLIDKVQGKLNGSISPGINRGVPGIIENAYNFSSTGVVTITNNADINFTTKMTLAFWINFTDTLVGTDLDAFDKDDGTYGYQFVFDDSGAYDDFMFRLRQSDGTTKRPNADTIVIGKWYHVVGVANGSDVILYINGAEADKVSYDGTIGANSQNLLIKSSTTAIIDEVGLWSRGLNASEVAELYNSGVGLGYPFDKPGSVSISLGQPNNNNSAQSPLPMNATITPTDLNLSNATIQIWNASGTLLNETTNIVTGNETNNTNWTISGLPFGNLSWNVLACGNNESGGIVCGISNTNNSVFYGWMINSEQFTSPVFETETSNFILNLTIISGSSLSEVNFIYNNTNTTSASIISDGTQKIVNVSVQAPDVTSITNVSFFWNLTIDGTVVQTNPRNQTINFLGIDNCAGNNISILNYSMYDEGARTYINSSAENVTMEIYLTLTGDLTGETFTYYSNLSNVNPLTICINENLSANTNYLLNSELKYSSTNRVTEFHNLLKETINITASPLQYDLYDLASADSTEFLITVKDANYIPVEDALIEIYRQYLQIGEFLNVEIPKTDGDGRTIGHFVTNDEVYNILVKKDGVLIGSFTNIKMFCVDPNNDCRLNLNTAGSTIKPDDFINKNNISYYSTYDESTRTYTFIFSTLDGTSKIFNLTSVKYDNYANQTLCSSQITASSGNLQCIYPATNQNATAIVTIYVDGEEFIKSIFPLSSKGGASFGVLGYFVAFILILSLTLMTYTSAPIMLVSFVIGVLTAGSFGLLGLGGIIGTFSAFLWIIIAVGVLLWRIVSSQEGDE